MIPPWVEREAHTDVERFARAYWIGSYSGNNFMIALSGYVAYLDRSADPDSEAGGGTVVAGFASSVEEWALWEEDWKAVLAEFRVPYFHMKEFNSLSSTGPFSGEEWRDETHRRNFIARLVISIRKWARVSVADHMEHQMYRDANILCEVDDVFNAYAECGRNCTLQVREFIRTKLQSSLPISYVFDKGDQGRGMLTSLMERCDLPAPVFKRSRPDPKRPELDMDDPPMIPLQAADLLAWELRRWKNDYRDGERMRKSMRAFLGMENVIWKECTYTDMARVIHSIGIPRRGSGN